MDASGCTAPLARARYGIETVFHLTEPDLFGRGRVIFAFDYGQTLLINGLLYKIYTPIDLVEEELMHLATQTQEASPGILPAGAPPLSRFRDADYLDIMCHEVGTPLTAVIALSHLLTDAKYSQQKKEECAEMLRESAEMLMGLMKNMLDSSRMEAGKIEIEQIDFDLAKVVHEAAHIIATKAAEKGLGLQMHIAEGLSLQRVGDPLRIRQILLNLLSNAVKFTARGSVSLDVSATTDADGSDALCITVSDTGIGMSHDELEKIFGEYAQANAGVSRKHGGTGLGLSISRNLARLMHGDITVKSGPGMGSHFIVTLPLREATVLRMAA